MGWFWADSMPAQASQPIAPHPMPANADAKPPPSCPMHNKAEGAPKPSSSSSPPFAQIAQPSSESKCPIKHDTSSKSTETPSYISKLNPLNYMPERISNAREASQQSVNLPLEREVSTIPRGDDSGATWEYPSPQQMYNAMLRKGYTDTPAEHVEAMVAVHNFLNEGAWEEIREWERRFAGGLAKGWDISKKGEERAAMLAQLEALKSGRREEDEPKLVRFLGRPGEPTPKARMMAFMAWLYPSQFSDNPPFDRHDWYVQRHTPGSGGREVRYVIDYYSGPPEPTGEPVFYLDVRPAIDGPTAACERLLRWGGDVWWRASGGSVREELAKVKR
ncbi:hypothetical protein K431DRAFT_287887 [Polychaeton citri CBS 116435]|uniref:Holocytochrome c-type synthase n=1 Tax=Polychaeton citri CBS 116435 TaxID=1314669 RepID=A0A9P4Q1Q7_9PEZI|nr:hypothetical protein K431DRAFT_287887 [Polychaeton citri CBS 116435]